MSIRVQDTITALDEAVYSTFAWYLQVYQGGQPSSHGTNSHPQQFVSPAGTHEIRCSSDGNVALPLEHVKEILDAVGLLQVSSLDENQAKILRRLEGEVERLSGKYANSLQQLQNQPNFPRRSSNEITQRRLLELILDPIRTLLALIRSTAPPPPNLPPQSSPPQRLDAIDYRDGGNAGSDLCVYADAADETPLFTFELKVEEKRGSSANYLFDLYQYVTSTVVFSNSNEHQSCYHFNPDTNVHKVVPVKDRQSSKQTLSNGSRTRGIQRNTLHKMAIQPMAYAKQNTKHACMLTNLVYDHVLFRHAEVDSVHHYRLLYLTVGREGSQDNSRNFFHTYLYICDQYLSLDPPFFPPLPDVTSIPPPASQPRSIAQIVGRAHRAISFNARSTWHSLRTKIQSFTAGARLPLLQLMLWAFRPTLRRIHDDMFLQYQFFRSPWLTRLTQVPLDFTADARQGVVLKDHNGRFMVKIYVHQDSFNAEVTALNKLRNVAGVPKLLATGTTFGGDQFAVLSKVGEALVSDVTDAQAQEIWDTILKHVHLQGIHHHDLVYHNVTRDEETGLLSLIDFGESGVACQEGNWCPDWEWLDSHNVRR